MYRCWIILKICQQYGFGLHSDCRRLSTTLIYYYLSATTTTNEMNDKSLIAGIANANAQEPQPEIQFITNSFCKRKKQTKHRIFEELLSRHHQDQQVETSNNFKPRRIEAESEQDLNGEKDPIIGPHIIHIDNRCDSIMMDHILMQIKSKKKIQAIKGPTGSIRGHKNCVKNNIENILTTVLNKNNNNEDTSCDDSDLCVAYVTSLGVVRKTYEDCRLLKSILYHNLIYYEERDIYLNHQYRFELKRRCGKNFVIPAVFMNGKFIGGVDIIEQLNETGEITRLMADFKMVSAQLDTCGCCGNARFIPCIKCHGSTKSKIQHSIVLKCSKCIDGLVQCPLCLENMKQFRHNKNEYDSTN